jgi:hypothetical protein
MNEAISGAAKLAAHISKAISNGNGGDGNGSGSGVSGDSSASDDNVSGGVKTVVADTLESAHETLENALSTCSPALFAWCSKVRQVSGECEACIHSHKEELQSKGCSSLEASQFCFGGMTKSLFEVVSPDVVVHDDDQSGR